MYNESPSAPVASCPISRFINALRRLCAAEMIDMEKLTLLCQDARDCLMKLQNREDYAAWRGALMIASVILKRKQPEVATILLSESHMYLPLMLEA